MSAAQPAPETFVQPHTLYGAQPNRLDVHRLEEHYVGVFREPFERIAPMGGLRMRPANDDHTIWTFTDPESGQEGRLLNVAGFLMDEQVQISADGLAYLVRDRGRLLALHLPPHPKRLKLTEANFKTVQAKDGKPLYPESWPKGLVVRVIRTWLYRVAILDEKYLLARLTV